MTERVLLEVEGRVLQVFALGAIGTLLRGQVRILSIVTLDLCLEREVQERIVGQSWLWLDVLGVAALAIWLSEGILVGSRLVATLPSAKMCHFVGCERAVYHTVLIEMARLFHRVTKSTKISGALSFVAFSLSVCGFLHVFAVTVPFCLHFLLHYLLIRPPVLVSTGLSMSPVLLGLCTFWAVAFVLLVKSFQHPAHLPLCAEYFFGLHFSVNTSCTLALF